MGAASLKLYDKFGCILRIETTTNNVSFFSHHRTLEHRDGKSRFQLAPLKKSIYSLHPDLKSLLAAANRRYLDFLADLDDPSTSIKDLNKLTQPVSSDQRSYPGYNFFRLQDQTLFLTLLRGEYFISGFRNKNLSSFLHKTTAQISYALKRLRMHGLIKRAGRSYKYYLTDFGRRVILMGLKIKELVVIPNLSTVTV